MAKKLTQEDLVLNIIVNGNKAQSEIGKLSRDLQDNKAKLSAAEAEMKKLDKQGATNSARYKQLQQDVKDYNAAIVEQKKRLSELGQSLKLEEQTQKQLEAALKRITQLRKQALPGSADHARLTQEMNAIKARIKEVNTGAEETGNALQRMAAGFQKYFAAITAAVATFIATFSQVRRAIEDYARFDDLLADVMKTTDLNKESVKELNAELEELSTRTSQEDLLGLSRIAGKLGYKEVQDIAEFVRANNEIVVALNEDLGGNVEETVNKIGKLVDIFKLKDLYTTEDAFRKVGSAINELGMASTANEGYMVEFARRMAGVAPLAGITIEQILGLGATLDQLGQTEEVASTALSKLFVTMAKDAKTYAKYAGMEINQFKDLLEKDFMGAFTKVLQGVKNNSAGINELAGTLGDLGQDGGRVIGVIGSLANNVDTLTGSINLSNKSMAEGTSITNEYNIKNQTAGAKLDIVRKEVAKLWRELGEKLWPVMTEVNSIVITFIQLLIKTINFIANNIKWISALALAFVTYYTAVQIAAKWEVITTAYMATKRVVVLSLSLAWALLTGNLARAAAAQRLLNIQMMANPYGLIAAAIVGLTALLINYSNKLSAVEKAQRAINDTNQKAIEDTAAQRFEIERLSKIIRDETKDRSLRLTAINQLREIMPKVLKDYSDEALMAGKAASAIKTYTDTLLYESRIKAKKAALDKAVEENERFNAPRRDGALAKVGKVLVGEENYDFFTGRTRQQYEDRITTVNTLLQDLQKTEEEYIKFKKDFSLSINATEDGGGKKFTPTMSEKDRNKAYRNELEAAEKRYQTLLQKENLFREDLTEMSNGDLERLVKFQADYQKVVDNINKKYDESLKTTTNSAQKELDRRAEAEKKYLDSVLIRKQTEVEAENNAYNDRLRKAGLFGIDMQSMDERQKNALAILESEHHKNLLKITTEGVKKEVDRIQSGYKERLADMRIAHHEELSGITTLAQAKSLLAQTMSAKELKQVTTLAQAKRIISNQQQLKEEEETKKHLETLLKQLQDAVSSGDFEGVDLAENLLPEEKKKILLDHIRELKEELAKLKGEPIKSDLKDPDKNVDILGMTTEDWKTIFSNLKEGRIGIEDMIGALGAATEMWSQYTSMVSASENAQLQKDEEANNKKKENLKKRFDAGAISQEQYNKESDKLDKQMDRRKAELARKQAKREKSIAIMSAIVNTAKAVTAVLPNFILAAIVGAFGALQIGTIAATPLPSVEGREAGGTFKVERSQDGKVFNAKMDPDKRGYVSKPTVLVGESGEEWVANAETVRNPTVKPILDVLDTAQRNGTINTIGISDILAATALPRISGRQGGGTFSGALLPILHQGTITTNCMI